MENKDYYDQLNDFTSLVRAWEKVANDEEFLRSAPPPPTKLSSLDFEDYNNDDELTDDEVITEWILLEKEEIKQNMAKIMANSPNPIRPNSIGIDQETIGALYTPQDLKKLEILKNKLYKLLVKIAGKEASKKKSTDLRAKADKLREEIEKLSNQLGSSPTSPEGDS